VEDDPRIGEQLMSELLKQMRSENKGLQLRAAKALIEAPAELRPRMMPKMMELLKSERENDKYVAALVLGQCGPAAKAAVPGLLPMLEGTQYERNRAAAAKALGQILKGAEPSPDMDAITRKLVGLFEDKYPDVRREALTACGTIGLAARSCIPDLTKRMGDAAGGSSGVRDIGRAAVWACGEFGPLSACHIDRLIFVMHGGPVAETVEAIGKVGAVNDNVVPNIVDRMEQVAAGTVIAREGDRTPRMSGEAIAVYMEKSFGALERFGPKAAPATPYLVRLISAADWERRKAYALGSLRALRAIGPAAKEAVPVIKKCQASSDAEIRKAAEEASRAIEENTEAQPGEGK
jgi:hypothetical protein